ncbi:flagellar M-ring protein FliF, partial [Enterobacter hormaechei]|nr:flagellar M-ring protein FliF [Enterobacter hormaechei]
WLLLILVAWLLWRKMIVPQIAKKRAAEKAALDAQKNQLKQKTETNAELDEKMRRQMARQRVNAELQSQRIRELAEKDPRVVALVIRQWMSNEQ